ncbi:2-amino-4-hydroxy-6-hydroxymethyldihydropteridine diphosphokinase [Paenibacillus sp. IB182496]|uniref:2-amino-4-hydroxy-6-hydroxymethyldihydropteridine diphosphokinase n=1 Tax=Paenibacillus sabuli TaxID=2772509 RepID=A0A927BWX9_9BACL|nr:2-amino-4-hydroxy-6-hydroxymethyldihydropteridine diphosphokinase [Paenibacillus sabuli]MBD2848398.1 2-amino-4-hydroxy-6-hydroxymethyldihydropteridine diphosphokinase [Paenibacillus sabuli]
MDRSSPLGPEASAPALAYIALGSNLGARDDFLRQALRRLDETPGVRILQVSGIYETDPVGYTEQPAFLNMAAALRTRRSPHALLGLLLETEQQLGRVREQRWGPRTIDLDLLAYEDAILDESELILPHPRMMERAFVLVPLSDVLQAQAARGLPDPHAVQAIAAEARRIGKEGITLWNTISWPSASAPSES